MLPYSVRGACPTPKKIVRNAVIYFLTSLNPTTRAFHNGLVFVLPAVTSGACCNGFMNWGGRACSSRTSPIPIQPPGLHCTELVYPCCRAEKYANTDVTPNISNSRVHCSTTSGHDAFRNFRYTAIAYYPERKLNVSESG